MHKIELSSSEPTITPAATAQNAPVDQESPLDNNQTSASSVRTVQKQPTMARASKSGFIIAAIIAILAGIGTGYGSSKLYAKNMGLPTGDIQKVAQEGSIKEGDVFGSPDTATFQDNAKGYLEAGGLENEGTHHLVREGGISQTVYLTSSVTDLSKLEGMEVQVWGETFKGQKAGWLMDVGRVQIIAVQGEKPAEE